MHHAQHNLAELRARGADPALVRALTTAIDRYRADRLVRELSRLSGGGWRMLPSVILRKSLQRIRHLTSTLGQEH